MLSTKCCGFITEKMAWFPYSPFWRVWPCGNGCHQVSSYRRAGSRRSRDCGADSGRDPEHGNRLPYVGERTCLGGSPGGPLPARVQAVFDLVTGVIALGFTIWLTQGMVEMAIRNFNYGWVTGVLEIPRAPFMFLIALSLALACVVLVRDLIQAVMVIRKGG